MGGSRGTGWVITQFVLIAAIVGAAFLPPDWPAGSRRELRALGLVLAAAGAAFALWAGRMLGRSLTPFPRPVPAGLATGGPFAVVRHPIYSGGLAFFVGYSLCGSVLALALTLCLGALWAGKIRVEERLLATVYDDYDEYRARVRRRLIPFVY